MLACENCGTPYELDSLDLSLGVAHCASCDTVAELRSRTQPLQRPPVPQPLHCPWEAQDGPLHLRARWLNASVLFMLIFAVGWIGTLSIGAIQSVRDGDLMGLATLAVLPHSWIGVGLAYYVLASLLNTTEIRLQNDRLLVRHGPMPWWGQRDLDVTQVDQLYVQKSSVKVNKQPRWNLIYLDKDGIAHTLLRLLTSPEEGRWLEYVIETALAIENRPVVGEE